MSVLDTMARGAARRARMAGVTVFAALIERLGSNQAISSDYGGAGADRAHCVVSTIKQFQIGPRMIREARFRLFEWAKRRFDTAATMLKLGWYRGSEPAQPEMQSGDVRQLFVVSPTGNYRKEKKGKGGPSALIKSSTSRRPAGKTQ